MPSQLKGKLIACMVIAACSDFPVWTMMKIRVG